MTIEERAENYVKDWSPREWEFARTARGGYIKGATEQQKIDIDKACEWLSNATVTNNHNGEPGCDTYYYTKDDFLKAFRKAMKD